MNRGAVILKAENILGGTILSMHYVEAPEKTQSICILNGDEVLDFCRSAECYRNWEKADEMSLIWNRGGCATIIIGTSTEELSAMLVGSLRNYMIARDESKVWKLGAEIE